MSKVEVRMLGSFTVLVNGKNIIDNIRGSKKSIELIQYFLVNKDRAISMNEIFDILWPNDENTNPESALRTRISRFRAELEKAGLKAPLQTISSFYRWNEANPTNIDILKLEELCHRVSEKKDLAESEKDFENILEMYNGDMLADYTINAWVAPKSMYYHNLFIDTMHLYVRLLEDAGRYTDVSRVARRALECDQFDSELNLKLMDSLLKTGKNQEAFARYNYTTGMHYSYLGVNPSSEILDFYKKLIRTEQSCAGDIDTVFDSLTGLDSGNGAFVCEYAIFKDIYLIYRRNLKRMNTTMFLAMVTLNDINEAEKENFIMLDNDMMSLLGVMKENLRIGDTISRYSPSQFILLLPTLSWKSGQSVLHRIKNKFYEINPSSKYVLNFKLKPLDL